MACNEAVYLACMLVTYEFAVRYNNTTIGDTFQTSLLNIYLSCFTLTFLICTLTSLNMLAVLQTELIQQYTPYLYMLDSIAALGLGWSLCERNIYGVFISVFFLSNFCMLHLVNRIFVGKKPSGLIAEITAMLKSFVHHTASFLFLDVDDSDSARAVIALTALWRALSMSGHAAQALNLKKFITPEMLFRFNWALSHARNVFIAALLYLCYQFPSLRIGFGRSAVGHVAYILVRAGPVFRLGSVYVGDRPLWQGLSDANRLRTLLAGRHPFLTIEVGSLACVALIFLYWRLFI